MKKTPKPVDTPDFIVIDDKGNAMPVGKGQSINMSPDGVWQQVVDSSGNPTGDRKDGGDFGDDIQSKCIICNNKTKFQYIVLCKEHTQSAIDAYNGKSVGGKTYLLFKNPEFKHHCCKCGEFENRVIVYYPEWLLLCNICIKEAADKYGLEFKG